MKRGLEEEEGILFPTINSCRATLILSASGSTPAEPDFFSNLLLSAETVAAGFSASAISNTLGSMACSQVMAVREESVSGVVGG